MVTFHLNLHWFCSSGMYMLGICQLRIDATKSFIFQILAGDHRPEHYLSQTEISHHWNARQTDSVVIGAAMYAQANGLISKLSVCSVPVRIGPFKVCCSPMYIGWLMQYVKTHCMTDWDICLRGQDGVMQAKCLLVLVYPLVMLYCTISGTVLCPGCWALQAKYCFSHIDHALSAVRL